MLQFKLSLPSGFLLFCTVCGAYSWKRTHRLAKLCPRRPGPGTAGRRSRIAVGFFPDRDNLKLIGPPQCPSPAQLASLGRRPSGRPHRLPPASWPAKWDTLGQPAAPGLTRAALLSAYGQDEASLAQLAAAVAFAPGDSPLRL